MKLRLQYFVLAAWMLSCNTPADKRPGTAVDTGRSFIRATLDGDFTSAESFLFPDSQNIQLFASYKELYLRLKPGEREAYKNASYTINSFTDLNDSVSLINYSNSYMKKPMNIKLVRKNKLWQVDFKYTSEDTTENK